MKANCSLASKAILNGIEGGEELKVLTIYCVSRDLTIRCNENTLSYWLEHANYKLKDGRMI